MKKIEELFKHHEGMTVGNSTVEERHEIWELLFEKNMICDQNESLEKEHFCLAGYEFYFSGLYNSFLIGFIPSCENNIPFKEFKNRLLNYND